MLSGITSAWRQLMWLSSGHTQMLHGSHRPWMGQPHAHKDPSAKISEKEEKRELFFSHLHFKCVEDLGILDLIKWTSAFRMVGKQGVGKSLCPSGSGQGAELHHQCLRSHILEWLSWENGTPSGGISIKCLIDGNSLMIFWAQQSRKHFVESAGALLRKWQSWNCSDKADKATETTQKLIPGEGPLFSPSTGDGFPGSTMPCRDGFGFAVTGWRYLRGYIALLVSQDWKSTNAKNAPRTSWSQGPQMRSYCWSVKCWAPNLTLLFHLLLPFWAKKYSILF